MATSRKLAGEFDAKPGRCAGNQGDLLQDFDTVALTILPGSSGGSPTGSASTCSMPLSTSPQTVYCRSRKGESLVTMKNWLLALFGSCERAIETAPRLCDASENSALIFGRSDP